MALNWVFLKKYRLTFCVLAVILFSFLIYCLTFIYHKNRVNDNINIKLALIVFRHGDRTPTDLYPKDPHINHSWPGGLGALSNKGISQMFTLGKKLRLRYKILLRGSDFYKNDCIIILSSPAERCISSAKSFLNGFIPDLQNQNLLSNFAKTNIIKVLTKESDNLLAQKRPCPKYNIILEDLHKHPPSDVQELKDNNKELYEILNTHTGKNVTSLLDVLLIYNTLEIEENNGLILPDWTKKIYPEKMLKITKRGYILFTETEEMKKMKAGPIITQIYENMLNKKLGTLKPDRNIFIYSGHDTTLINIMNSLNILNQTSTKPEYASTLIFELHRNMALESDDEVKIFYYIDSNEKFPKTINIPNCSKPCTLNKFGEIIKHLIVKNYDVICKL